MRLTRTLPPAVEPISLAEAKYQCKIRHTQADDALATAIRAARELAEERTGRALVTQGWSQLERCAPAEVRLGAWPVQAVTRVAVDGLELGASGYVVFLGDDPCISPVGESWAGKQVVVEFTAGYGDAGSDVPAAIKRWALHQVANAMEHSGSVVVGTIASELKFVEHLLDPYIIPR